jgi:cyanophycinase-like exopeptidase
MSEAASDQILSVFNLRLHVLSQDDRFNLLHREPIPALTEEA